MAGKTGNHNIVGYVGSVQKADQGCLSVDEQRTDHQTDVSKVPTKSKKKNPFDHGVGLSELVLIHGLVALKPHYHYSTK